MSAVTFSLNQLLDMESSYVHLLEGYNVLIWKNSLIKLSVRLLPVIVSKMLQ